MRKTLLIFGPGYVGRALAEAAEDAGYAVHSIGRHDVVAEEEIKAASHIFSTVAPDAQTGADPVLMRCGVAIAESTVWKGYCSTTGVYGDRAGAWVDESARILPRTVRQQVRMDAEAAWQAVGAQIFRLAGIYGPERNVLEQLKDGTARRIDKPGHVFSRIHVEDIAGAVLASMEAPNPGRIYNVCDDMPAPAAEVVAYGAQLLGMEPPPLIPYTEIEPLLSPMLREFYGANRRVSNRRLKEELGYTLRYPGYREGVSALARKLLRE